MGLGTLNYVFGCARWSISVAFVKPERIIASKLRKFFFLFSAVTSPSEISLIQPI